MAMCGSIESSDCLVTVLPHDSVEIQIDSVVLVQFGDAIREVVQTTLKEMNITGLYVHIADKGAFDHVIRARLVCAIQRMNGND